MLALNGLKEKLCGVVGTENVTDNLRVLEEYSMDYSFVEPRKPMLVVYPRKVDEVPRIVKLANENKLSITPVSSGPPRFRGDTVPCEGGIILDLSRLKRILKIDERNRIVMVEPGVTFGELVPELRQRGLRLAGPLLPRASKSVLTCFLEREPLMIPRYQWDYTDPILTLNVVLGTGDILRTGSASGPGPLEELAVDFVNPFGPGQADFFRFFMGAQGSMGIVTWATIKVELMPKLQRAYFVPSQNIEDLVEFAYSLMNYGFGGICHECFILNNFNLAVILSERFPEEFDDLRQNLPPWVLIFCLAGHRRADEILKIRECYLMELAKVHRLEPTCVFPGAPGKEERMVELLSSPWDKEPYWKLRYRGSCQDIFFLTTLDKVQSFIDIMCEMVLEHGYSIRDLGVYVQPLVKGTACHCEFSLFYNPAVSTEVNTVKALFLEASEALMNRGAYFSRPYGPWAGMVYSRYGEGTAVLREIKRIFDPNNVLNPGKIL